MINYRNLEHDDNLFYQLKLINNMKYDFAYVRSKYVKEKLNELNLYCCYFFEHIYIVRSTCLFTL